MKAGSGRLGTKHEGAPRERMVTDSEVTHVIVICDKQYAEKNKGDVDENNHFTSVGNCGRRQKWRYTWGYVDQL